MAHQLEGDPSHNICAYLGLDSKHSPVFKQVIVFLLRSRIHHAISVRANVYKDHQRQFWRTAKIIDSEGVPTISAIIHNKPFAITVNTIRDILQFPDTDEDPIMFADGGVIQGCFRRMKYDGNAAESQLIKSNLSVQWKYLMHVLIHCLSPRKGGYNACRISIQCAMVALVLNMPFNFSQIIFNHLKENITTRQHKFLMYPRFLQLMINAQLPNISKVKANKLMMRHMSCITLSNMLSYRKKTNPPYKKAPPPNKVLFGHITNPNYVAPPDGTWKHEDEHDGDTTDEEPSDESNDSDLCPEHEVVRVVNDCAKKHSRDPNVGTRQRGRRGNIDLVEDYIPPHHKRRKTVLPVVVNSNHTLPDANTACSPQDQPTTPKPSDGVYLKSLVITRQAEVKELKETIRRQNSIIKAQQESIEAHQQSINSLQSLLDVAGTSTSGDGDLADLDKSKACDDAKGLQGESPLRIVVMESDNSMERDGVWIPLTQGKPALTSEQGVGKESMNEEFPCTDCFDTMRYTETCGILDELEAGSGVVGKEPTADDTSCVQEEIVKILPLVHDSQKACGVDESRDGIGSIPTPSKIKETRKRHNDENDINKKPSQRPRVKKHMPKISFDDSKREKVPKAQTPGAIPRQKTSKQERRMRSRKNKLSVSSTCMQKSTIISIEDVGQDVQEVPRATIVVSYCKRFLDFDRRLVDKAPKLHKEPSILGFDFEKFDCFRGKMVTSKRNTPRRSRFQNKSLIASDNLVGDNNTHHEQDISIIRNQEQIDRYGRRYVNIFRRRKKISSSSTTLIPTRQVYRRSCRKDVCSYNETTMENVQNRVNKSKDRKGVQDVSGALVEVPPSKKRKMVPKNDESEPVEVEVEESDEDTKEWWQRQRNLFRGRVDSFIAKMHVIQGDRRFSPWKGSVTDSVAGVFLTQNVADQLSSSAFMSVAGRFPVNSRSKEGNDNFKVPNNQESVGLNTQIYDGCSKNNEIEQEMIASCAEEPKSTPIEEPKVASSVQSEVTIEQDSANNHKESPLENELKGKKKNSKEKKQEPKIDWEELRKSYCKTGEKEPDVNCRDAVDWDAVRRAPVEELAKIIEERGMHNVIAGRIKLFLDRIYLDHGAVDLEWLRDFPPDKAKEFLLSFEGIGLKSVECVRLLTLHQTAFPVDTNVGRVATRLGWVPLQPLPDAVQIHLLNVYPRVNDIQKYLYPRLCTLDKKTLYELHYQLITFGKVFCTKRNPNCDACPMKAECRHYASAFASGRPALPGTKGSSDVTSIVPAGNEEHHSMHGEGQSQECEPIIEVPPSPEPEVESIIGDIEDLCESNDDEIPTIRLNTEEFRETLEETMDTNMNLIPEADMSKALIAVSAEAANIRVPPKKFVAKSRTMHLVYELPDFHPCLAGFEERDRDDPTPYLLAVWYPGENPNSLEYAENRACMAANGNLEETVKATILIPCRTANRGTFPLNGTYFQVNEMFADDETSHSQMDVPRRLLCNLPLRELGCGTSVTSIFKALSAGVVQCLFWRGSICVRGFNRQTRQPRPLHRKFHIPRTALAAENRKQGRDRTRFGT
ncbi:putative HhH-GPD domain, endonuclease III-like, iron-sulfur cluster loop, DNA glycosylase [Helianthus debilis subsp. tardiflorus]